MAIPLLLYGIKTWTLKKRDWNKIQASEIKYLRTVKFCISTDQFRNEDIRKKLDNLPLFEKNTEYRCKWKIRLLKMEQSVSY